MCISAESKGREGKAFLTFTYTSAMSSTGGIEMEEMEARLNLYNMIFGYAQPMALRAAVLLNIPHIIALHGHGNLVSVEEIASHIASSAESPPHLQHLFRLLRFLASTGVFTQTVALSEDIKQCKFGLTSLSKLLLPGRTCAPQLLLETDKVYMDPWRYLQESVLEGCQAFTRCHGMHAWEYANKHPQINQLFNEGMASDSEALISSLLEVYDGFKDVQTLVDVGGGLGSVISQIVNKYNHIRGINYDLPHVVASAPPIPGVQHVGGSMFEDIPSADAIFMKMILHSWDDDDCVRVLKKCHDALPPNGKVIIVEAIVGGEGSNSKNLAIAFDLMMMVDCIGGRERTEQEFKQLFGRAGFKNYTVLKLPSIQSMIEVTKF